MLDVIWILPLLPLLGFLFNALLAGRIADAAQRERAAGLVASGTVLLAFGLALVAFVQLGQLPAEERRIDLVLWLWISTGELQIPFGLLFDPLSAVMVLLVTGVGGLIHIYSIGYMHGDARVVRYFAYLNLFIVMMLLLVLADNMLLLFLGWEGVGLCSFLLIGHWYERKVPGSAAVKAFVVNRVGDAAIILAMVTLFATFGSLNFFDVEVGTEAGTVALQGFIQHAETIAAEQVTIPGQTLLLTTVISLLLLIGVTGKSAQIPLFVWLPDAMAGPTPVSALIHAATMVTAGVYLIARTHPIFSDTTLAWVTWIGTLTAFIAATAAIAQWDIKRVLAYSTVSQLGYMVAAAGMGAYVAAIFHLLTHGIFKALLFLGSGSVIHGTHETQDMRKMGGLRQAMPITFATYLVGTLALAGIFPLAGFWSKDEILAHAWFHQNEVPLAIFVLLVFSSLLTAFYMGRQVALVFFGQQRDQSYHAHESSRIMTWPLIILAVGALVGGAMNLPGLHALEDWLEPVFGGEEVALIESATLEGGSAIAGHAEAAGDPTGTVVLATVLTVLALGAGALGWRYYLGSTARDQVRPGGRDPLYRYTGAIWESMEEAWGFDWLYEKGSIVPGFRGLATFLARIFDAQGIDGLVNGVGRTLVRTAVGLRLFQSGYVRNYALVFLLGVIIILGYLMVMM